MSQLLTSGAAVPHERRALRAHLLQLRRQWLSRPEAHAAQTALVRQLGELLRQLEPQCLGLYWPLAGEFGAPAAVQSIPFDEAPQLALPFAYRDGRRMDYRHWDGAEPRVQDECGIPSSDGAQLQPDVVLVPCVGFTREGYRLGYGGGYYDRWLADHPGVTSVGLAWSCAEASFAIEPHDRALTLILTEDELIAP